MKKKLTQLTLTLAMMFGLTAPVFVAGQAVVLADAKSSVCEGIGAVDGSSNCEDSSGTTAESTVKTTVQRIITIFSWVAGVAAVFMVMLGGFWYITSNGDTAKTTKGRQTILYAIVGLVIIAFAQVIVRFVVGKLL